MKRVSTEIIQKSQLGDKQFSKVWFIGLLEKMSAEDFDLFCREVMLLNEFHDTSAGLHCTDMPGKIIDPCNVMFELNEIDFNRPITFKKIN